MTLGQLIDLNACQDALNYYTNKTNFEQAWNDCHRGDWMLWIASKLKIDKRTLFLAKARCAKTVLHLMTDERSREAVKVAEKYGLNKCDELELRNAAASAAAAAYAAAAAAADADAAADAYSDAADAADAAYAADAAAAAYAADAAAAAAASGAYSDAAASAAYAASGADAAAGEQNQQLTANICRQLLTEQVFQKVKEYGFRKTKTTN